MLTSTWTVLEFQQIIQIFLTKYPSIVKSVEILSALNDSFVLHFSLIFSLRKENVGLFCVTCGTNTFQRQPDQKILSDALQALHQNNVKPETEQNKKGFIWMSC